MKIHNKLITIFFVSFISISLNAQQVPMYTHYMYNTLSVNPAYAGSRDALTVTALHRSQWVDFKGAPNTQTVTVHAPLRNQHIGLGIALMNDKIGPINTSSVNFDFAFIMKLSEISKLSLGLNAGTNLVNANLSTLEIDQQNDPAFENDINNQFQPNVGFGAYYSMERFYAGVSVPSILQNNYTIFDQPTSVIKAQRHYYLITGALFDLGEKLAFKPTALLKVTEAAPIQGDVTAAFILNKRVLLGAMIRTGDAYGVLLGVDITEQLHVGYSYDFSYGLKTLSYNQGSHEIVLRYDFLSASNKQIHSPRYF